MLRLASTVCEASSIELIGGDFQITYTRFGLGFLLPTSQGGYP